METTTEDTTGTTETTPPPPGDDNGLGDAGKRALDAERKARAAAEKALKDAQAKLREVDDAGKSDLERLQGQVADLTTKLGEASGRADRFEIAAAKGLSLAQARRLVGSSKDELEADADELRKDLGLDKDADKDDKGGETTKTSRPQEDLKLGASNADDEQPNPGKVADAILKSAW